jgi:hypothetical protein
MSLADLVKEQSSTGEFQVLADQLMACAGDAPQSPPDAKEPARRHFVSTPAMFMESMLSSANQANSPPPGAQFYLDQYFSFTGDEQPRQGGQPDEQRTAQRIQHSLTNDQAIKPAPDGAIQAGLWVIQAFTGEQPEFPSDSLAIPEQTSYVERSHEPEDQSPRGHHLPGRVVLFGPYEIRPACGFEIPFGRDYHCIPHKSVSRLAGYIGLDEYSLYIREVPQEPALGLRPSRNGIWLREYGDESYKRLAPGEAARISTETEIRVGGNGIDAETGMLVQVCL